MAEDMATPRVNAEYLNSFQNQTVRIIGRVTQLRGEQATIDAQGSVTVLLNRVSPLSLFFFFFFFGAFHPFYGVMSIVRDRDGSSFVFGNRPVALAPRIR